MDDRKDDDSSPVSSIDNFGNMIGIVCDDGIVVSCLKQFHVVGDDDNPDTLVEVYPKKDSEYDRLFVIDGNPKLVLCGVGGHRILCPLVNRVAEEVRGAKEKFISRPTIKSLSDKVSKFANSFLIGGAIFHLFIAGVDKDFLGNSKLDLRYINQSGDISIPNRFVAGSPPPPFGV
ncbi:uncharacterized protein LOC113317448 isoform X2 [Papaver somniferum]|uniref:uncharacterized protein LOC113317448 isoform X2 n=1 Tax=Papaver somniferum TaxID=3469 RepID=UPI000E700D1B|nr:uncharacterized protein LOC113317448 isoform X2 [Papaver somniferum]